MDYTPNYTFTYTDGERIITHTVNGTETWSELLPHFQDFLKGVGFIFDGTLDIVED